MEMRAGESCASHVIEVRNVSDEKIQKRVLIITPQMAYNFSVRLEEYLENVTWEN